MDLKTRKRMSIFLLVVGLPAYIIVAVTLMNWVDAQWGRQPVWIEILVYIVLGIIWVLPLKRVFQGVGRGE